MRCNLKSRSFPSCAFFLPKIHKRSFFFSGICFSLFFLQHAFLCQAATLSWSANDPSENITGYKIYYGFASRQYQNYIGSIDVGNVTSYEIENIIPSPEDGTTYFFAATACSGLMESEYSAEASYTFPALYSATSSDDAISEPPSVIISTTEFLLGKGLKGETNLNDEWTNISYNSGLTNPIVIVGPPTYNDSDPGIVQVQSVTADSFQIRFQEGQYLEDLGLGAHAYEDVSFLTLEEGVHSMPDGSIWEAGSFDLSANSSETLWKSVYFSGNFPDQPYLFLTIQTVNGGKPAIVRVKNLSKDLFQAALFEEEILTAGAAVEKVGYLAIHSNRVGKLLTDNGEIDYLFEQIDITDDFSSVLGREILLQEEQSEDVETTHTAENVNALLLGDMFFSQVTSFYGADPIVIRQRPSFYSNTTINNDWSTVNISQEFDNPVIITGPPSYNDTDPGVVRLRNITNHSFEIKFREWNYLVAKDSLLHELEVASWLALDPGIYMMEDGTIWEVGTFSLSGVGNWLKVNFDASFDEPPALFLTAQTTNGIDTVSVRSSEVSNQGFMAALFEEEVRMASDHATEIIGYLAIHQSGSFGTSTIKNQTIDYEISYTETDNLFHPILDYEIMMEEEQSADYETDHPYEELNILKINNTFFAQEISSYGVDPASVRFRKDK